MNAIPQLKALPQPAVPVPDTGWRNAPEQRLVLLNVPWSSYAAIGDALPDRPNLRMTYEGGILEFMTLSPEHEVYKKRFARFIDTLAEECNLRIVSAGSMTFRRQEIERGFEPDDCFWIAHELHMRARLEWDPERDPPPDLALEIEISRSAMDRMRIYAAFRVPEVWCCDGESLSVYLLQPDGTYQLAPGSPTFPAIPVDEIPRFLKPSETVDYLSTVRTFRDWVRKQLAGKKRTGRKKKGR
jgi:Uma2 family endonuclease